MRARLTIAAMIVVILCSCAPIPLRDLIVKRVVEGTILYVDASAAPGGDGKSWKTAYRYLQDALDYADAARGYWGWAPAIYVAEGVYYPDEYESSMPIAPKSFDAVSHMKLYGGFPSGGGTRDPSTHVTVLSGDIAKNDTTNANGVTENPADIYGDNADTVVSFLAANDRTSPDIGEDTLVDGFTICGSEATGGISMAAGKGAICSPTLSNLVLQGNTGGIGDGGALVVTAQEAGECSPRLEHVMIKRNSGGMRVRSGLGSACSPILLNVSFIENTNCALRIYASDAAVSATLINARFEGNTPLSVSDMGGAAYFYVDGKGSNRIEIVNSLFVGNTADSGGAICSSRYYPSTTGTLDLSLVNVTFSQNRAQGSGGAVYNSCCSPTFDNCIFWNDTASAGGNEVCNVGTNAIPVFTASDVAGSGGSASWGATLGTNGGGNIDQDPLFIVNPDPGDGNWSTPSDNNYGSLVLSGGSPARNAGRSALLPFDVFDLDGDGNTSERIPVDLSGGSREQGASVDMGAYESP